MKAQTLKEFLAWQPTSADLEESILWLNETIQKVKQHTDMPPAHRAESIKEYEKELAETKLALKSKLEQEQKKCQTTSQTSVVVQ